LSKQFRNILVGLDTRIDQHPALQAACRLLDEGTKLKIVDVVPEISWLTKISQPDFEETKRILVEEKSRKLEVLAEPLRVKGLEVKTKVLDGKTSVELAREVIRAQHDLVVRVSKGSGSHATGFFGTTGTHLLRICPCPVLLINPGSEPRFSKILAAIDPDPKNPTQDGFNRKIVDAAGLLAGRDDQHQLHVVHTWEIFNSHMLKSRLAPGEFEKIERNAKSKIASMIDQFLEQYGLSSDSEFVHLLRDEIGAGRTIPDLATQLGVDVIVMGTVARSGVAGALIGNTAEKVLNHAECSIMAVKPNDFVAPITVPMD